MKFNDPNVGADLRDKYSYLSPKIRTENAVPIFKVTMDYNIPGQKNQSKKHAAMTKLSQFPLRLSWASTVHKVQGVTIPKGTNVICHGDKLQNGMAYVMFSRSESMDNVFLTDDFELDMIRCVPSALIENKKLEQRSIVSKEKAKKFNIFYANAWNLNDHMLDIQTDIHANQSDLICLVETWMDPDQPLQWAGKDLHHASLGNGKGVCVYAPQRNEDYIFNEAMVHQNYQIISFILMDKIQLFIVYLNHPINESLIVEVAQYLESIIDDKYSLLCIGDFNFEKNVSNHLTKMFKKYNVFNVITIPTHDSQSPRTLDQVYISDNLKDKTIVNSMFRNYTDHITHSFIFE